jgi:uncharacterized protein (DUF2235 family)
MWHWFYNRSVPMKRIVLCMDGTWNTVTNAATTNVVRFAQSIVPEAGNGQQIVYYNAGVGTDGPLDKVLGGFFGIGLKRNVQRAYMFCALNYQAGDEIYIFGFSRGAYSARAVAGIIGRVGLVYPRYFDRFEEVWQHYRRRKKNTELADPDVPIKCVGVWDTVGSYGIPAGFGLSAIARMLTWRKLHFHDTSLGHKVAVGLHAMAIDEHRRPFTPTPWTQKIGAPLPDGQTCEQVWFAGAHGNVGGGYANHGLSDVALVWMMARVSELTGLRFDSSVLKGIVKPDAGARVENSLALVLRAEPSVSPQSAHAEASRARCRPALEPRGQDTLQRQRGRALERPEARRRWALPSPQPARALVSRQGDQSRRHGAGDLEGAQLAFLKRGGAR